MTFDTGRRDATFYFQSTISDQGSCSFANTYTEGTYFLDNVQLDRVSVIDLDPFEKQQLLIDDQGAPVVHPGRLLERSARRPVQWGGDPARVHVRGAGEGTRRLLHDHGRGGQ
ncbi:MAG: hypothetical protein IPI81_17105 [Flavobacteriales bacterium]|nr:hypothetical protein [Flavobacteriales bacterium]